MNVEKVFLIGGAKSAMMMRRRPLADCSRLYLISYVYCFK